jgi:hypothetical protein
MSHLPDVTEAFSQLTTKFNLTRRDIYWALRAFGEALPD